MNFVSSGMYSACGRDVGGDEPLIIEIVVSEPASADASRVIQNVRRM